MLDTGSITNSREAEILEVVFRNGWGYMRGLLVGAKPGEPEVPPPEVLRNIFVQLGPVFVKFGQLLSTRPDLLSPSYIECLSHLQSKVPAVDAVTIEAFIRQNSPVPVEENFSHINYTAIAAGSIGQTHRATLRNGRDVAIKVRRPGIEVQVEQDIALILRIAGLMNSTQFGERYGVLDLAEEFSNALRAELDFTTEAAYTDQLRQNLAQSHWFNPKELMVPEILWELTTPKLMTMEWLQGKPLLAATLLGRPDVDRERKAITTLLFRAFFHQFFIDGFFHADPHPGNIFYLDDGRLAILDCGMVGNLDPRTRTTLTEMVLAIVSADAQRCTQLALQIAEPTETVNLVKVEADIRRLLQRYANVSLASLSTAEAFNALLQIVSRNNLRWPANIGLFAKSVANLEGVARQFNPAVNVVEEVQPLMTDIFQRQLFGDNPLQLLLRTGLEFRNLSLESPRQFAFLLNRLTTETLRLNLNIQGIDDLRQSIDSAANRRTFGTVVSGLIVGAAILSTGQQTPQLQILSEVFFVVASLLGFWLLVGIIRSGG
ncbi:ABC transporter [Prochlorothrix hollandica PCC 9006 = CALU 1027]|uniref:ABC transporter n=2 Tax=Prochlorothrix hollandica TaxID=1223 RepID=A0A0M2Q2S5_PROHO|nr:AarF/ABC1/UbiB kinase family protein [Prochlorothrix hollandica]KKJ01563.1 ABC transporter [Prochlorothrix hollandica PCC 9006 = CALU 1027]